LIIFKRKREKRKQLEVPEKEGKRKWNNWRGPFGEAAVYAGNLLQKPNIITGKKLAALFTRFA
jgi:hypothetical protein